MVAGIESGPQASSGLKSSSAELLNLLEPAQLIDAFLHNPPEGFTARTLACAESNCPIFLADFDLLTTLDEEAAAFTNFVKRFPFLRRFLRYPALFVGTTATEYVNYPQISSHLLVDSLLKEFRLCGAQLLIIKDIPSDSPLLSASENEAAGALIDFCREAGFSIVSGQALAYVPINFATIDEFLARMSRTRRKDYRRKLRDSKDVEVEELETGHAVFSDKKFFAELYEMYLNVYAQSEIHFDLLSREFLSTLLTDSSNNGKVFLYKVAGKTIGYNICFVHEQMLVDKYVGFIYPDARNHNLYFMSWFYNLGYALRHGLKTYIAGWTDPAVKAALGANFTLTKHAVYIRNPLLRAILNRFQHLFESDEDWISKSETRD